MNVGNLKPLKDQFASCILNKRSVYNLSCLSLEMKHLVSMVNEVKPGINKTNHLQFCAIPIILGKPRVKRNLIATNSI